MSEAILISEKSEGIALLTLNRPKSLNALSGALRARIAESFEEIQEDGETRVVILTGSGRAFCAGIDLKELSAGPSSDTGEFADPVEAMGRFEGPIIGAINGHAITGGFELALACDFLIASTQAVFADTHGRVGLLPGWGLSQKLSRTIGIGRAKELSLTGNFLDANRAEAWGLVNRVVEPDELLPACRALATDMVSLEPEILRRYKRLIDEGFGMPFADSMAYESKVAGQFAGGVTPEAIATNREKVHSRGREQSRD